MRVARKRDAYMEELEEVLLLENSHESSLSGFSHGSWHLVDLLLGSLEHVATSDALEF
jgi:hypothetical protein